MPLTISDLQLELRNMQVPVSSESASDNVANPAPVDWRPEGSVASSNPVNVPSGWGSVSDNYIQFNPTTIQSWRADLESLRVGIPAQAQQTQQQPPVAAPIPVPNEIDVCMGNKVFTIKKSDLIDDFGSFYQMALYGKYILNVVRERMGDAFVNQLV
jgi:hypothetical protein